MASKDDGTGNGMVEEEEEKDMINERSASSERGERRRVQRYPLRLREGDGGNGFIVPGVSGRGGRECHQ